MVCPGTALLQNLAVSPGLTLRPSLSAQGGAGDRRHRQVSPGLTLRPSLSEVEAEQARRTYECRRG